MSLGAWNAANDYYLGCPVATRYTDNFGLMPGVNWGQPVDTHTAIAEFLGQRFAGPSIAQLNPIWTQYSGHGIKGVLADYVSTALFEAANTMLVFPVPGYGVIRSEMNRHGADVIELPLRPDTASRWLIELDQLDDIRKQRPLAKLIIYANIPQNPTGTGYTAEEWKQLLDWADAHDTILIVDEAYFDLYYNQDCVSVLTIPGWERSCIVAQSVSKGWTATGLRFGWIVAYPTMIAALSKVIDVKDSGLFGPSIAAGLYCLKHPELAKETNTRFRQRHQMLSTGLQRAGYKAAMPDAGLCQFVPAPKAANGVHFANAGECAQWLRSNQRISVMHGSANGNPYLRFAVTISPVPGCNLPDEQAVITELVRRLQKVKFEF